MALASSKSNATSLPSKTSNCWANARCPATTAAARMNKEHFAIVFLIHFMSNRALLWSEVMWSEAMC